MSGRVQKFRELVALRTGVNIPFDREYLVASRLAPLMEMAGETRLDGLIEKVLNDDRQPLAIAALDAMMTGETLFFRDRALFDGLKNRILPSMLEARAQSRRLRIWCSACSSGQEPYSVAMVLAEQAHLLQGWQVDLIATDISRRAVERARHGAFNQFEVQRGLPVSQLLRYFQREGESWVISENLRAMIEFRQQNLLDDFGALGQFDLVFCRNVLMYFDGPARKKVIQRIVRQIAADGWLLLGSTESSIGMDAALLSDPGVPGGFKLQGRPDPLLARVAV